jgi:hypothetical protein
MVARVPAQIATLSVYPPTAALRIVSSRNRSSRSSLPAPKLPSTASAPRPQSLHPPSRGLSPLDVVFIPIRLLSPLSTVFTYFDRGVWGSFVLFNSFLGSVLSVPLWQIPVFQSLAGGWRIGFNEFLFTTIEAQECDGVPHPLWFSRVRFLTFPLPRISLLIPRVHRCGLPLFSILVIRPAAPRPILRSPEIAGADSN